MANYTSKFSGIQIDRAVAYFNAIDKSGRTIITIPVTANDWVDNSDDITDGKFKCTVTLQGSENTNALYPPLVYLIQTAVYNSSIGAVGDKWDLNYNYKAESQTMTIICYSNIKIVGDLVLVTVLSDASSLTQIND